MSDKAVEPGLPQCLSLTNLDNRVPVITVCFHGNREAEEEPLLVTGGGGDTMTTVLDHLRGHVDMSKPTRHTRG